TVKVTLVTVPISMVMSAAVYGVSSASSFAIELGKALIKEPLEEVILDEIIGTVATSIAADFGADAYGQIIASSLAESGRETAMGPITSMFKQQSADVHHMAFSGLFGYVTSKMSQKSELQSVLQEQDEPMGMDVSDLNALSMFAASMIGGISTEPT
ncbi:unnamed protein product, partial [marine sediment metagenome]